MGERTVILFFWTSIVTIWFARLRVFAQASSDFWNLSNVSLPRCESFAWAFPLMLVLSLLSIASDQAGRQNLAVVRDLKVRSHTTVV
jgi:hypothetical protein